MDVNESAPAGVAPAEAASLAGGAAPLRADWPPTLVLVFTPFLIRALRAEFSF